MRDRLETGGRLLRRRLSRGARGERPDARRGAHRRRGRAASSAASPTRGPGMALALLDTLTPLAAADRLARFLAGPGGCPRLHRPRRRRLGPGPAAALARALPRPARPAARLAGPRRLRLPRGVLPLPRSVAGRRCRASCAATPAGGSTRGSAAASGSSTAPTSSGCRGRSAPSRGAPARPLGGLGLAAPTRRALRGRARGAAAGGRRVRAASSPRAWPSPPRRGSGPATRRPHTELACQVICGTQRRARPPR